MNRGQGAISSVEETAWRKALAQADHIHRYPAKMALSLAGRFIDSVAIPYLAARGAVGGRFFDPCCGSGTTALVAKVAGFEVEGIDLMPEAATVARAKVNRLEPTELLKLRAELRKNPLTYARHPRWYWATSSKWFTPRTLRALQDIAVHVDRFDGRPYHAHLWTALSQTCWDVSAADSSVMVPTHSNWARGCRNFKPGTVLRQYRRRLLRIVHAQEALARLGVPCSRSPIGVGDALDSKSWVGTYRVMLCSPPYGLGIDYIRAASLQGRALSEEFDASNTRALMIGRRHFADAGIDSLPVAFRSQSWVERVETLGKRDAVALYQYFTDLKALIEHVRRHLGPNGILGLVLGDPEMARARLPLTEMAREYARQLGFRELEPPLTDSFQRRFLPGRRRSSNGPIPHETLLSLVPN